jgi:hypothetical protein
VRFCGLAILGGLFVAAGSCGDSSLSIRVIFPDQAALQQARQLELVAVDNAGGGARCAEILGRRADQVSDAVAKRTIELPADADALVIPDFPLQHLTLGAVALDSTQQIAYAGCTEVAARPGDNVDVELILVACPGGNCRGCTVDKPCPAGLDCDGGVCRCLQNGSCKGCCEDNACLAGTATSSCGKGGQACDDCSTNNSCVVASCTDGTCQQTPRSDEDSCDGGICRGGSCCTGCWDGASCNAGSSPTACGDGGAACQDCSSSEPCRTGTCVAGKCLTGGNLPDGSPCPGGTCKSGQCCTGCWSNLTCRGGTSLSYCGTGGASCTTCNPPSLQACEQASCATGTCTAANKADGVSCTGGKCFQGTCCTGCWDATSQVCRPGNTDDYCGDEGSSCTDCTKIPATSCGNGTCS